MSLKVQLTLPTIGSELYHQGVHIREKILLVTNIYHLFASKFTAFV